ncbi:hypothetical protein ACLUUI_11375 [Enterobacterales bacterium AW_CKDN230030176-1A_HGKHYDSX7]
MVDAAARDVRGHWSSSGAHDPLSGWESNVLYVTLGLWGILTVCIWLFIAFGGLKKVDSWLSNSKAVASDERHSNERMRDKYARALNASFSLSMSTLAIRRGMLNKQDVERLPRSMRYCLAALGWGHLLVIVSLIAFYVWCEFVKVYVVA